MTSSSPIPSSASGAPAASRFPDLVATCGPAASTPSRRRRPARRTAPRSARSSTSPARRAPGVVPYGGGTSVVGGVTARPSPDPLVTVDLARLAGVPVIDERSGLVTAGAGTTGPALAACLAPHRPDRRPRAAVVGARHGRRLGRRPRVRAAQPRRRADRAAVRGRRRSRRPPGTLDMPPFPASAAGPDLRQLVLGSEGRLGILTDVVLRTTPSPRSTASTRGRSPAGRRRSRPRARSPGRGPACRCSALSTPDETRGRCSRSPDQPRRAPGPRGVAPRAGAGRATGALLLVGTCGLGARRERGARRGRRRSLGAARRRAACPAFADAWIETRFRSPYLRNALWAAGLRRRHARDRDRLDAACRRLLARLEAAIARRARGPRRAGPRVHPPVARLPVGLEPVPHVPVPARPPIRTRRSSAGAAIKRAASDTIVAEGATISHHHGVGTDHAPYLAAEKGALGMAALDAVVRTFDPDGIMNPGVPCLVRDRHGSPA